MFQDPLSGAVVGEVVHRVIAACEKVVAWPEYCAQLKQLLQSLEPLVAQITNQGSVDAVRATGATQHWLHSLKDRLDDAQSVLEICGDPKHRWDLLARLRCGSKLLQTTQQLKDLLQTQAVLPVIGLLQQGLAATDKASRDLSRQVEQLSRGLEAQRILSSEVINKDLAFHLLSNTPSGYSNPSTSAGAPITEESLESQPVPQFVFGMDKLNQQLEDVLLGVESLDDDDEGNVTLNPGSKWVGVWAKGGAGKTLLVQNAINNPIIADHFQSTVHLLVLGRSPDVLQLQKKLCYKVTGQRVWDFESPDTGKTKLSNLLRGQRCLLVLDDVWQESVLDWFDVVSAEGGRILFTSRNQLVLKRVRATEICVLELSSENSIKLFCVHAFHRAEGIPDHLEEVVKKVVAECKGLPLSLKVVGGALAGKMGIHDWEMALHKLRQADVLSTEYEEQIFHRLKLSYDDLEIVDQGGKLHKECFLYFAAFPEDELIETENLIQLWAGDGLIGNQDNLDPEIEGYCILGELIARSLIELDKGWSKEQSMPTQNCKIHDVLRDMALYILHKGAAPWEKRCLFQAGWQPSTQDVLPPGWISIGKGAIGARRHSHNSIGCNILQAQKLSLRSSKVSSLPSKLGTRAAVPPLQVMLLGRCIDLTRLDGGFLSRFASLRVLDLSWTRLGTLPKALGKLRELVVLNLQSSGVTSLPPEVGKLGRLEYLNLQDCVRLISLPGHTLSKLVSLKYLNTRGCGLIWRSAAGGKPLGQASKLMLRCSGGDSLEYTQLEALNSLVKLRKLWMGDVDLELLPDKVMGELSELRLVSLRFPKLEELHVGMRKLSKVDTLDLNSCGSLTELPGWVPESMEIMRTLDLRGCLRLSQLPSMLSRLQYLIKLELSGCPSLQRLPDEFGFVGSFPSLQELWLFACSRLKAFPELQVGSFPKLSILDMFDCASLQMLPTSIHCIAPKLRILSLGGCRQLAMPSDETFATFMKLEELNLKGMPINTIPRPVAYLPALKRLNVSECTMLQALPAEHSNAADAQGPYFPSLQELTVAKATSLTSIPTGIIKLPSLKRLDLTGCDNLEVSDAMRNTIASRKGRLIIKGLRGT